MSRTLMLLLAGVLLSVAPLAAQQQTTKTLYVTLQTRIETPMKMPGMPQMPQMPGMPTGAPTWSVNGRAVYAAKAVEPIFLTVPADLKLAENKLPLRVPKAGPAGGGEGDEEEGAPTQTPNVELTNKLYWHPEVAKGPVSETLKVQGSTGRGPRLPGMAMPDVTRLVDEQLGHEAEGTESKLPAGLKGAGDYLCNTGGAASLSGFLPPLKVTLPEQVKPAEGFTLTWEAVPGARGYLVSGYGMNMADGEEGDTRKMTTISWFSTLEQPPLRIRGGYRQETTIADDLEKGVLLPGETTSCQVPAGVFKDIMMLRLKVEAVGSDFYNKTEATTVFGTIRSEWNTTIFALPMGMGGGGGEDE